MNPENEQVLEQFQAEELESRLEMWKGGSETSSTTGWEIERGPDGEITNTSP